VKKPATACVYCGGPLPPLAVREGDPYCSTVCARAANGVRDHTTAEYFAQRHEPTTTVERNARTRPWHRFVIHARPASHREDGGTSKTRRGEVVI